MLAGGQLSAAYCTRVQMVRMWDCSRNWVFGRVTTALPMLASPLAEPSAFVAKKAYDVVGKPLVRNMDERMARIVAEAQAGSTVAKLKECAILMGFSPLVAGGLATWAQKAAQEMTGGEAAPYQP